MSAPGDKTDKREVFRMFMRRLIDFVFGFKNKRGQVLDYKLSHADEFNFSPREFYAGVEQKLAARKLPGVEISRVDFAEGGLLSDQRIYLRVMRERLCIDTCAAPFGNIFFVSCRTVHVPALVRLWHLLAALAFFGFVNFLLVKPLGPGYSLVATVALAVALVGVLRNASSGARSDLDTLLLKIPVVATIYEDWFRVGTYYREDTRNLYLQLLPQFIEEHAQETCAANGVKLVPYLEPRPPISPLSQPKSPDQRPAAP